MAWRLRNNQLYAGGIFVVGKIRWEPEGNCTKTTEGQSRDS